MSNRAIDRKRSSTIAVMFLLAMTVLCSTIGSGSNKSGSGQLKDFLQATPSPSDIVLAVPIQETVQTGSVLTFTVNASDPFNASQTVYLSASGLPLGASFPEASGNPISATLSWAPTSSQGPGNYTVTFEASFNQNSSSVSNMMSIHVAKGTKPLSPVLTVPGPQTIAPGTLLSFALVAMDPNFPPSPVNVTGTGLPQGSTFDAQARIFSWRPTASQAPGIYVLMFTASDQIGTVVSRVTITVANSSTVLGLSQSPVDYLAYSTSVLIPALGLSLFYIYRLKSQGKTLQRPHVRIPEWLRGSPDRGQTRTFPGQPRPNPDKEVSTP